MEGLPQLSEEEQLRLKKKRERNNKISKLMGDYLLKGYKMLGTSCNKCQAILLRDRQGEDYCVGCEEVDAPSNFPPDVTRVTQTSTSGPMEFESRQSPAYRVEETNNENASNGTENRIHQNEKVILERSVDCIFSQIAWANNCLAYPDTNLEQRTQLVSFIKNCYETVDVLKKQR